MVIGRAHGRGWNGWFATLIISIFLRDCYLEHTRFLSLSDKKLVIVSTVIPAQTSWKQRDQSSAGLHKTCSLIGPLLHVMKNALGRWNKHSDLKDAFTFLFLIWFWILFLDLNFDLILKIYFQIFNLNLVLKNSSSFLTLIWFWKIFLDL